MFGSRVTSGAFGSSGGNTGGWGGLDVVVITPEHSKYRATRLCGDVCTSHTSLPTTVRTLPTLGTSANSVARPAANVSAPGIV
jgi:hypothetical protein